MATGFAGRRAVHKTESRDPRHADIPDPEARHLAAWHFLTNRRWSGTELAELSTADAAACVPREWLAAMPTDAPPTAGAMLGAGATNAARAKARRNIRAQLPAFPPPTWLRGSDGHLYPARRRDVVALVIRLTDLLPTASNRAIARLVGCSHETVAEHRRPRSGDGR